MKMKPKALDFSEIYNGESKKRFVDLYDSKDSKLTLFWQFLKVTPFEKGVRGEKEEPTELDKDMCEMSHEEIEEMLVSAKCSTITSAINHINTYKRYIDFVVGKEGVNPFHHFDSYSELASRVIDAKKNKRYSREDLMYMIEELNNDTDKALLLALFEGIKGKSFSELLTLKTKNLSKVGNLGSYIYIANVYDEGTKKTRPVKISEELYLLLEKADRQDSYSTNNQNETVETPFNDSEFIFKKAKKGKQGNGTVLDRHFITRKFIFFKEFFGNEFLTADDMVQSGMMHMAYELFLMNNKIGKNELLQIGEHYNTIMATSNGVDYYRNTTVLKRIIFNDEFRGLYTGLENIKYSD
ncbi:hypothetical protein ACIQ1D_18830 [Lysinibacillus xylanilyticus]|uniref:phage lytic cycle repressor MrpR family protein n=1 Tax=Lysinibacillus xylanilyticus TaxID=582475 RepID=UPI00380064C2